MNNVMSKVKLISQFLVIISEIIVVVFLNTVAGNPCLVTGYTYIRVIGLKLIYSGSQFYTRIRIIAVYTSLQIINSGFYAVKG